MSPSRDFVFTVLTGPNAGAAVGLQAGRFAVGGGRSDDIVLDGLAEGALSLTLEGERVRITAHAGGVSVGDSLAANQALAPGAAWTAGLPTFVHLGEETVVSLARRRPQRAPRLASGATAALVAAALVGGGTLGFTLAGQGPVVPGRALAAVPVPAAEAAASAQTTGVQTAGPMTARVDAVAKDEGEARAKAAATLTATSPRLAPCTGACLADAADSLGQRIAGAGLDGLEVAAAEGLVRITGSLPADRLPQWEQLRARFEAEFGRSLPLIVALDGDGDTAPSLAVASVWLGAAPELRTKTGQVLRVGDQTGDGWQVQDIAKGAIALQRGTRRVTVSF